ncbi:MAG: thioredoxin domain-containing protein [Synoicihabitans sp.]
MFTSLPPRFALRWIGLAALAFVPTFAAEPNRLIDEKSPYLRQHAYNPVDWYPWGEEAFAKAQTENKPIFLSVGYSTCHWCHVMADESFANEETAAFINEHFVAIKVDREERPDVDHIYMSFVQAATGNGGWPLNVWLTPERKPFFGGVYFAPEDRGRRPGFPTVLKHLADLWAADSDRVREQSDQMIDALAQQMAPVPDADQISWETLRDDGLSSLTESFDASHGGFDVGQKFPSGPTLEFLLDLSVTHPDHDRRDHARQMLNTTLEAIATQSLHDHVGGGFHRYAVDPAWGVPHFEKMLYDQAQIAHAMLSAWQLTERPEFRAAAESALSYVAERLTHPDGGFYSAEDAVSLPTPDADRKIEGAYYTWTTEQLATVIPAADRELVSTAFGIRPHGNVAKTHDIQGELAGKNVLHRARTIAQLARQFERDSTEIETRINRALELMKDAREARPRPHLDDKIVTAWNGLMISAYARAGQVLSNPHYIATAQRAARFLRDRLYDESSQTLSRSYRDGQRDDLGFAEDYALVIQGLLDLYETDFDLDWLQWAADLQAQQDAIFWDNDQGGYFASDPRDESIVLRLKIEHDGVEPAATSTAVRNLGRLAALWHDEKLLARAEHAARSMAGVVQRGPAALPQLLAASGWLAGDAQQALIHSAADDAQLPALLREVWGRFHPRRMIVRIDAASRPAFEQRVSFIAGLPDELPAEATAYICENFVCQMPTSDRVELAKILDRAAQ